MTDKDRNSEAVAPEPLPPEPNELAPAVRDVAYQLTHDLRDTHEDIRDAAAFAPLALVKAFNAFATRVAAHPRKTALAVILLGGAVGLFRRRRRR
jgi:hypothetical protein